MRTAGLAVSCEPAWNRGVRLLRRLRWTWGFPRWRLVGSLLWHPRRRPVGGLLPCSVSPLGWSAPSPFLPPVAQRGGPAASWGGDGGLAPPLSSGSDGSLYGLSEESPINSDAGKLVKSVFEKENGLEEADFGRADHWVSEAGGHRCNSSLEYINVPSGVTTRLRLWVCLSAEATVDIKNGE